MAIEDRNLTTGTPLWARYQGVVHQAEVIETTEGVRYRLLPAGPEFKSPSAAATAITGKSANGWSFWSVGAPTEKPPKAERSGGTKRAVNAVPKPEKKTRSRKEREVPKDGNGNVLPIVEQPDGSFECGHCDASFPTSEAAATHLSEVHVA